MSLFLQYRRAIDIYCLVANQCILLISLFIVMTLRELRLITIIIITVLFIGTIDGLWNVSSCITISDECSSAITKEIILILKVKKNVCTAFSSYYFISNMLWATWSDEDCALLIGSSVIQMSLDAPCKWDKGKGKERNTYTHWLLEEKQGEGEEGEEEEEMPRSFSNERKRELDSQRADRTFEGVGEREKREEREKQYTHTHKKPLVWPFFFFFFFFSFFFVFLYFSFPSF